ncbi:MAG TPA: tRNA preQ1(34) S-adenosylmethionine ribosyltransferase-isomerase QueA [Terriglobales bacterium]|nr:tRNA preQ1(34) S-adenosylmethionine ribosyltransferase-isomerase QueA [Terriglobales bacterium]
MLLAEFDFHLPPELIAQRPAEDRDGARMLHLDRQSGQYTDTQFRNFVEFLRPDDLMVFNNTRVFPARLFGYRAGLNAQPVSSNNPAATKFLKGKVEVLLTRQVADHEWLALVHPGRKIGIGERLFFPDEAGQTLLEAEVIARGTFGERTLRFQPATDFFAVVERIGHIPLPPYIDRPDEPADHVRYQTIYARPEARGSVAAPTAGLHFTPEIMSAIRARGVETAEVTLHVGLGTFQPLRNQVVEENKLHLEAYAISEAAADTINRAKRAGRRIVAIGTTTVRTLEFAALRSAGAGMSEAPITATRGDADIFIYPGFKFQIVDALLTNFHLPQSSLLMLVSAFAGRENVLRAYDHAVAQHYRFFSYGDCMFIE